jgi:hypothetical protein
MSASLALGESIGIFAAIAFALVVCARKSI